MLVGGVVFFTLGESGDFLQATPPLVWVALGVLGLMGGFASMVVGFWLYGVATLRARVLPRWCGLGLIIIPPITLVLGDNYGSALLGLLWLALGYVLWSWKGTAAAQPSRVS